MKFLRHRIADERVLRLIGKWLAAGVIEDGAWSETEQGSPQGASVSPLLANVYLHYVLDLWADWWRKRYARGDMIIVRFADDFVAGSRTRKTPSGSWPALRERFAKFSLELHPEKTRLIEFGRHAARRRKARGDGQTGDVRVPGVHAHLRDHQARAVLGPADHRLETDAGQAARGQRPSSGGAAATTPSPNRADGWPAWSTGTGLLRRARQRQGGDAPSGTRPPGTGTRRCGAAARKPGSPGNGWTAS